MAEHAASVGLILAGGRSRRMGGRDKAFATIGGVSLVARAVGRLGPQCTALAISAGGDLERFEQFGLPVLTDAVGGFAGPLAGILAGLDWIAREHPAITRLTTVAVDTPFLPLDLARRLSSGADRGRGLACAGSGGRRHPVAAMWPVEATDAVREALAAGEARLSSLLDRWGCETVEWSTHPVDPFFNVNTPNDLESARAMAASCGGISPGYQPCE